MYTGLDGSQQRLRDPAALANSYNKHGFISYFSSHFKIVAVPFHVVAGFSYLCCKLLWGSGPCSTPTHYSTLNEHLPCFDFRAITFVPHCEEYLVHIAFFLLLDDFLKTHHQRWMTGSEGMNMGPGAERLCRRKTLNARCLQGHTREWECWHKVMGKKGALGKGAMWEAQRECESLEKIENTGWQALEGERRETDGKWDSGCTKAYKLIRNWDLILMLGKSWT